jgi:hypothetical protein
MNKLKSIFRIWLPFAVVITALSLLVYTTAQQMYRQGANDPQIQMANDTADALNDGQSVAGVMPEAKISVAKSLAPFLIVYDTNGNEQASSVVLDGKTPQLPDGVLDSAKKMGEDRVTWQPREGVRIAAVIVPYKQGFVLAGRNMGEMEARVDLMGVMAGVTWIMTLVATLFVIAYGEFFLVDKK